MRHYLLSEQEDSLGLLTYIYDEDEGVWYKEHKEQLLRIHKNEFDLSKNIEIPG